MTPEIDKNRSSTAPSERNPHPKERPAGHPEEREHEGATEDEVTPTMPPAGPEYDDEPRQG
jgi:hypothetical protein